MSNDELTNFIKQKSDSLFALIDGIKKAQAEYSTHLSSYESDDREEVYVFTSNNHIEPLVYEQSIVEITIKRTTQKTDLRSKA